MLNICHLYYSCYPVPSPTVSIDVATSGSITYAGNNVTLNCGISLLGGVTDSDVTVNSRWTKDGAPFSGVSGRVTNTSATRVFGVTYLTQLIFSPLSSSMDNGTYVCITTLTPRQPQSVIGTTTSASFTLAVGGEVYLLSYVCGCMYLYLVVKYILYMYDLFLQSQKSFMHLLRYCLYGVE